MLSAITVISGIFDNVDRKQTQQIHQHTRCTMAVGFIVLLLSLTSVTYGGQLDRDEAFDYLLEKVDKMENEIIALKTSK